MNGNADGAGLVRDGAGNGLPNPPGGVGGEFEALGVVKLLNRLNQAQVALLNQVQELHTASHIALGDGYHQTKVCLAQALLGFLALFATCLDGKGQIDFLLGSEQRNTANFLEVNLDRVIDGDAVVGQGVLEIIHTLLGQPGCLGGDVGHILVHHLDAVAFQLLIKLFHLLHINAAAALLHGIANFGAGQFAGTAALLDQCADGIFLFCHK